MLVRNQILRSSRMLQFQSRRAMSSSLNSDIIARANNGRTAKFIASEFKRVTRTALEWGGLFAIALFWCAPNYYYKKYTSFGITNA